MADKFSQILAFIDRPWKVAALVILIIVGGGAWIAYEKRDVLIENWLTPDTIALKVADIPAALEKLASETTADLLQIWEVDLGSNSQRFLAARRHDGERPVIPSPRRLPIFVHVSDIKNMVAVLEGQPICVSLTDEGSPLARRLAERGMVRGCAIPIPPNRESFLGVIYLAWEKIPDKDAEDVAVGVAREIARTLVTR